MRIKSKFVLILLFIILVLFYFFTDLKFKVKILNTDTILLGLIINIFMWIISSKNKKKNITFIVSTIILLNLFVYVGFVYKPTKYKEYKLENGDSIVVKENFSTLFEFSSDIEIRYSYNFFISSRILNVNLSSIISTTETNIDIKNDKEIYIKITEKLDNQNIKPKYFIIYSPKEYKEITEEEYNINLIK